MTRAIALVLALAWGCAHSPSATIAVTANLQPTPADDGTGALYRVCVGANGKVQSVDVVRMFAHYGKQLDATVWAMKFRPQQTPTCGFVRMLADSTTTMRETLAAEAKKDAAAGTPAKPKNVPPYFFDVELVERTVPHLPDSVKAIRAGETLVWMGKLCAGTDGRISQVSILAGIEGADEAIRETLRTWKLRPQPIPICTLLRFEFDVPRPEKKK